MGGQVLHELPVVIGNLRNERSSIGHVLGCRGLLNGLHLLCGSVNSTGINLVTKVGDRGLHETTPGPLQPNAILLQPGEHCLEILLVLLVGGTRD